MIAIDLKPNEPLHIGDNIVVVVVDFNKFQVKVGVNAPSEIGVYRQELLRQSEEPK